MTAPLEVGRSIAEPAARTGAVTADASLEVTLDDAGRRLRPQLRSDPPLVLRRTGPSAVHLVAVGGGPVAGDAFMLKVLVGAGADLSVRQLAATVALPSARPGPRSTMLIDIEVQDGARLDWFGEPTVAAAGCHHESHLRIRLHGDASLRLRDEVVGGRHGEPSGLVRSRLDVWRDDTVLLRSDSTIGDPHWVSAAVGGGARVSGTALIAGPTAADVQDGRALTPDDRPLTPDDRALTPDDRPLTPDDRPLTPDGRAPAPGGPNLAGVPCRSAAFHLDAHLTMVSALGEDHPAVRSRLDAALASTGAPFA